ncbi:MAG: hypothetical protein RJA70_3174 [Pseudomonadota bacterium]|jgi:RNA polymerase sigma-70 factor (ECF subfamily)
MATIDGAAFEDCYRRVFPLVLAKCRRMLPGQSDATDVAQEVFVRLWREREWVRDPQALTAWLYRTATRLVIDRARHATLSQVSLGHLQSLAESGVDDHQEEHFERRRQLQAIFNQVPEQELEAAILNRFDRLTQAEIAEVLDVGERTVRRLLDRFDARASTLRESC